jgi:CheY-like chemotaxis protein
VRDAANALERRARERGLEIRILPRGTLPEEIESDPTRLHQILLNLIQNAIKFTEHGHVGISVAVEPMFEANQGRLAIEVMDTGIGIDPHALEQIFEPFRQADASTRRRFGGAGLGLTVSRRLARLLGGELLAQSAPGQGSVFRLEIPVGVPPVRQPGESAPEPQPAVPIDNLRGRVLLAEDGPDNQRLITRILKRAGLEVDVAGDGAVAFARALAAREAGVTYDVILMDMSMPEVDGYEATRRLRAAGYDAPIVALTAHAMIGDREVCMEAGCDAYLSKPIHRPLLLTTLAVMLRKQRDAE